MKSINLVLFALVVWSTTAASTDASEVASDPGRPWLGQPPADCPFPQSDTLASLGFTDRHAEYTQADTWYPSWAANGNLYSPWTDGVVNGLRSNSADKGTHPEATTGYATILGGDPLKLRIVDQAIYTSGAAPYQSRYPCGSLVHNGVWYYGTYCLGGGQVTKHESITYNWPWLGPFVGFRWSTNFGRTWTQTPCTPAKPLLGEHSLNGEPIKIGAPHFVDFGKNLEHSPDGKAYLVAHGASDGVNRRFGYDSWITGDEIYLLRVTPTIENINDASQYEFFDGSGWTHDFSRIKPIATWRDRMGCVTMTYNAPLKKYLMCVTDGVTTGSRFNTYVLESDQINGPFKLVQYLRHFGEQGYFVNFPSKFISADGKTLWLSYSGNFATSWDGQEVKKNPLNSGYSWCLQETKLHTVTQAARATQVQQIEAGRQTIVCPDEAPPNVKLAAREIRRYVYLRTGQLLRIGASGSGISLRVDPQLAAQQYRLQGDGASLTISGGSDLAVVYGAYQLAEKLGVRFYLHGDVVPDERASLCLPVLDETAAPMFSLRGIQPFHDFFEGPDWWNADDYKAYASQLAKLRMNFIGLHNYPQRDEGYPGPEPTVWIGLPEDHDDHGHVTCSYPGFFANTLRPGWGNVPMKTSDYVGGASALFDAGAFGPEAQQDFPWPAKPAACNAVFNRVGDMYREAFTFARALGIKICVGTETPLTVPEQVKVKLKSQGRDLKDPGVLRDLYKGVFGRLTRAFPVDYYWLWTPEDWTWSGNAPSAFEKTQQDIRAALEALHDLGDPFPLATCGWVLGPAHNRAALAAILPPSSPMSCINRQVGHEGVETAFANLTGRPKWAIPWFENDPNLTGPQPWAARMRYDAVDAHRFGCTGLFGLHWRTKALEMNVAALAAAAWDQSWVPPGFDITPVSPSTNTDGALGGQTVSFTATVEGTTVPAIYQTVRYDVNGYDLGVPDGTYTVTLQFNEPAYSAPGKRVFGVRLQGRQVVTGLDVFARVGANHALDLRYPDIDVSDGKLHIEFTREVEFPCIAGIVIQGTTKAANQLTGVPFVRRIDCGGPASDGYEADAVGGQGLPPAGKNRAMPIQDFYQDYARANFGEAAAEVLGDWFEQRDGPGLPEVSGWNVGPGVITASSKPWSEEHNRFAFVDELAVLRARVKGQGNLERFDYWLNTYRAMATMAELSCLRGQLDRSMKEKDYDRALAARIGLAAAWSRLLSLQTAIVRTPGELGTIANLEQQTRARSGLVSAHDEALVKALGHSLPPQAALSTNYAGEARLILPTVRSLVVKGEPLRLRILALDRQPMERVVVHIRPLGKREWREIPAAHLGRAVFRAELPAAEEDFEYWVSTVNAEGLSLVWPATAPEINQTVVVMPGI